MEFFRKCLRVKKCVSCIRFLLDLGFNGNKKFRKILNIGLSLRGSSFWFGIFMDSRNDVRGIISYLFIN